MQSHSEGTELVSPSHAHFQSMLENEMPSPRTHLQSLLEGEMPPPIPTCRVLLEGGNVPSHAEPDSSSSVAVLSFSCYFGEQNTFFRPTDVEEFVEGSHLDFPAGFSSQYSI